mmetsp:Transcript_18095/g.42272  ORF Transcript_18095/g.42272 Transcript_18095/m.42272 type:complete len:205 (+) Transcript_18095:381-995(+)
MCNGNKGTLFRAWSAASACDSVKAGGSTSGAVGLSFVPGWDCKPEASASKRDAASRSAAEASSHALAQRPREERSMCFLLASTCRRTSKRVFALSSRLCLAAATLSARCATSSTAAACARAATSTRSSGLATCLRSIFSKGFLLCWPVALSWSAFCNCVEACSFFCRLAASASFHRTSCSPDVFILAFPSAHCCSTARVISCSG